MWMDGYMAKGKKRWFFIPGFWVFIIYIFAAARPIPEETVLKPRWITSLESDYPVTIGAASGQEDKDPLPFLLGDRYGYVGDDGKFLINTIRKAGVSVSEKYWAEYEALPSSVQVLNPMNENVLVINNTKGYPLFLDGRIFMVGSEQNSLTAVGPGGKELWTYDFPAPLTCVDAAGGAILAGTLDGALILLNASGSPVFTPFEPGGSRFSVILGCALSRDASRIAVVSGIDEQRFLLMERSGDIYRIIYHEFLGTGFRRPVHVSFVDNDGKAVFEREGGLGIYDIGSRVCANLPIRDEITVLDNSGGDRFLFLITTGGPGEKRFIVIRYPSSVVINVPFKSDNAFFTRRDNKIYLGGNLTIASFELEKK
jgi:hypothetical protein